MVQNNRQSTINKWVKSVNGFVNELRRRNPLLFRVSVAHLVTLAIVLAIMPFDDRLVTGINPWIKPAKFALSNATFLLAISWILFDLALPPKIYRRISIIFAVAMVSEIVLITFQAARGTTSHFNVSSLPNVGIQLVMGTMILFNTLAVAYIAWRFWRGSLLLPRSYLWGIRFGLLIFLLASFEGFAMVGNGAHTVGAPDGGPGLPGVYWNTKAGDLRIAHFFGLHALQVLPIIGHSLHSGFLSPRMSSPAKWSVAAGIFYGCIALLLFVFALMGRPLISF
jgi:hypothetical protein